MSTADAPSFDAELFAFLRELAATRFSRDKTHVGISFRHAVAADADTLRPLPHMSRLSGALGVESQSG